MGCQVEDIIRHGKFIDDSTKVVKPSTKKQTPSKKKESDSLVVGQIASIPHKPYLAPVHAPHPYLPYNPAYPL